MFSFDSVPHEVLHLGNAVLLGKIVPLCDATVVEKAQLLRRANYFVLICALLEEYTE